MNITFPHAYLEKVLDPATAEKKRRRGRCVMHGCRRVAETGKSRCHTCQSRIKRIRNPLDYAYRNLKASAVKRGIGFELTLEEFAEFCEKHGYLEKRGKQPESLTIDRRDTKGPYSKGNIRPMTYHDNVSHKFEETSVDEI